MSHTLCNIHPWTASLAMRKNRTDLWWTNKKHPFKILQSLHTTTYLNNNLQTVNFYKIILRERTHHIQFYLCGKHRIKPRLGSKFSVQYLIPGYVFPLSFYIPASCSRHTGYGIGRASCCRDLTSPFSPTESTEGSLPAPSHTVPKANRTSNTCRAKAAAQLSPELSRSLSEQAAEQAAEQAGLDFPLYCNPIYCKRNSLQQTPLFRKGSLWVEGSQEPASSILRVVSDDKERNQGHWSVVTTFQYKCWQWQSPIKFIPNTEKEKNWPKSLTFSYGSLLLHAEHCCWHYPYQITIKKKHAGPAFCVLMCCEHGRADVSWQPRTVHKQNEGLITKQQIKALPSVHDPLGKRDTAIYWHSVLVMLLQALVENSQEGYRCQNLASGFVWHLSQNYFQYGQDSDKQGKSGPTIPYNKGPLSASAKHFSCLQKRWRTPQHFMQSLNQFFLSVEKTWLLCPFPVHIHFIFIYRKQALP